MSVTTASEIARQIQIARASMSRYPEIRMDLVESTRKQIEDGTFVIDTMLIARRLLGLK